MGSPISTALSAKRGTLQSESCWCSAPSAGTHAASATTPSRLPPPEGSQSQAHPGPSGPARLLQHLTWDGKRFDLISRSEYYLTLFFFAFIKEGERKRDSERERDREIDRERERKRKRDRQTDR